MTQNRSVYIFSLALLLLVGSNSSATTPAINCGRLLSNLDRTLGVEWEYDPVNVEVEEGLHPILKGMDRARAYDSSLARSQFRNLFSFYGRDTSKEMVKNLIPDEIVRSPRFVDLLKSNGQLFEKKEGYTFLKDWIGFESKAFITVMRTLYEARGEYSSILQIQKIPEAWITFQTDLDKQIPNVVAEEWRNGGHFAGLEFPMQGHVFKKDQLKAYLRNLWVRLGLFPGNESGLTNAIEIAVGHVHWVPKVDQAPLNQRELIYQSIIGYWGDVNDTAVVNDLDAYQARVEPTGLVKISKALAESLYEGFFSSFYQYSIVVLIRATFERIQATPYGILIKDREKDLNTEIDLNVPPEFKRLYFGLRGFYSGKQVPAGAPVPIVGIEARNMPTMNDNVEALPKKVPGTSKVDSAILSKHGSTTPRGLIASIPELQSMANRIGLSGAVVTDLATSVNNFKYPKAQAIALFFVPLNDWLSHPLVQRTLFQMTEIQRQQVIARYHVALANYVIRVNELSKARQNPRYRYQPDWEDRLEEFPDGINRVYSRLDFPEIGMPGDWNSNPDMWFQIILANEAARFIAESGLGSLLKMP